MSKFWNNKVKGLKPYVPGEQPKDKKYIKLNTNENPYPPSPKVIEAIKEAAGEELKLYPDPNCSELISVIANHFNVNEDQVFVGNGSDEVLAFSFMTFFDKDKKIMFPEISYSFYEVYGDLCELDYTKTSLDKDFNIIIEDFYKENGGIIIPNPNAPTTKLLPLRDIESILTANKESVVIIDEAYIDFGGESAISLINKYDNLLVVQTLSKSRSLAGLRVGYGIGNKDLIQGLNMMKNSINSYTLDRLALVGAIEAFKDRKYFESCCNKIIETRQWVTDELRGLGFNVIDSKANFIFVSNEKIKAEVIFTELREDGILVRYFKKDKIDNYLRITIGTDKEMEELIKVLKKIIKCHNM